MGKKCVSYAAYESAFRELKKQVSELLEGRRWFQIYDDVYLPGDTVVLEVNWASIGNVSLKEGEDFAEALLKAITLAKNFKYNGYTIK